MMNDCGGLSYSNVSLLREFVDFSRIPHRGHFSGLSCVFFSFIGQGSMVQVSTEPAFCGVPLWFCGRLFPFDDACAIA